jgi:hypothetical protein
VGASESSGELGALSNLSSSTGAGFANQRAGASSAEGISVQSQIAADARQKAKNIKAFGELINTGLSTVQELRE